MISTRNTTRARTRSIDISSGWLPESKGYVLLAACRPSESAYEYAFEGEALPFLDQLARIERNISVAAILEILLNKKSQSQIKVIEDYTKMVLACLFY